MDTLDAIRALVAKFDQNKDSYLRSTYNEAQVRTEFIDPLFEALGWDVANRQGFAEAYKEVIHEDAVKIGSATKAPDYSFRIGGVRKFFVEAKKPSVDIHDDPSPAFQLRRYAWSAKLPLSVLTDFQEFAVYDCRVKPALSDNPSVGRLVYLKYTEYEACWTDSLNVFSKDGLLHGSFDRFAASNKVKKGTTEVDNAFLAEIESWRSIFAHNIALRNPRLSQRELNFAVQRTIDRLIFLRICEDRGIEEYGNLLGYLNGENVYKRLCSLFREADDHYNSGLFHFREEKGRGEAPDGMTLSLSIDDKVLKDLIRGMYYPNSPYEFSVLPADILGQVYEQFLGKVIRLTEGHHARVEDKPEVKKAGGVYYTPTYIVEYIVKNTVGKLLEGKTPKEAAKLRIVDPACSSGSFLIGAYQLLLDWHRDWYVKDSAEEWSKGKSPALYQARAKEYRLTAAERKRILLNNIYGVDIDPQAVEVTKLSLLLKVLEGENEQSINQQLKLFHERALPDLENNIKCGNSLIGPDFYQQQQLPLLTDEDRYRINVFDWRTEFARIFAAGGFDAVVGNPPYIRIQIMKETQPQEVDYYGHAYRAARQGNYDIYVVFVERCLGLLNKNGKLGFILPNKFFNAQYGLPLREVLSGGKHLDQIVHFGDKQVFASATTYTCLLFLSSAGRPSCNIVKVADVDEWRRSGLGECAKLSAASFGAAEWNIQVGDKATLRTRMLGAGKPLGDVADLFVGLQTSADKVFVLQDKRQVESRVLRPFLTTGGLCPYHPAQANAWLLFPYEIEGGRATLIPSERMKREFPKAWAYLRSHEETLRGRDHGKWNHDQWYAFGRSQNLTEMDREKLVIQVTAIRPTVILDGLGLCMTGGGAGPFYGIRPLPSSKLDIKFLLGVLNSKAFGWLVRTQSTPLRGGYVKFSKQYIETAPIPQPTAAGAIEMAKLVDEMLDLNAQVGGAKTPQEQTVLTRRIETTGMRIDRLVCGLYGLTDDEIRLVEEELQG